MVKEKYYIEYKEMQNIPIWNFSLKFKFHYGITEYCILASNQQVVPVSNILSVSWWRDGGWQGCCVLCPWLF